MANTPPLPRPFTGGSAGPGRAVAVVASGVALLIAVIFVLNGLSFTREDAGHVGVVRNGGPLDNRNIRQIVQPGQGNTWTGWFSQSPHEYPASTVQRFYTVTADPSRGDRQNVDVINVPTQDGVQVGIEGTVYFNFVGESDTKLLEKFDSQFGTRRFSAANGGGTYFPWEGDQGFGAMLDTIFRPVLDNDLRQEVGAFQCRELVSSCALVRQASGSAGPLGKGVNNNANIAAIQTKINTSLQQDLDDTLGAAYFHGIRFRLARVTLPAQVQRAVDQTQAKYAAVQGARAEVQQARYQNERNALLARTYAKSPQLAQIDAIKAAPSGATIIVNTGTAAPGINVGGGK